MADAFVDPDFASAIRLHRDETGGGLVASPPLSLSNGPVTQDPLSGAPFGGYLAALCVKAARDSLGVETPLRTLQVQFLSGARFEPVRFTAERLRGGRSTDFIRVEASQGGRRILTALVTFGADGEGPAVQPLAAEAASPPAVSQGGLSPLRPHATNQVEYRFGADPRVGGGAAEATVEGWYRMADRGPLDELKLCYLLDAIFPAFFPVTGGMPVTTVDLRYDVFGQIGPEVAPDGWVRFDYATRDFANGWAVEDGFAWSAAGRPLASARQLRKMLARPISKAL